MEKNMYCTNCQCESCRAQRVSVDVGSQEIAKEALRIAGKGGAAGRTLTEMVRFSRPLRALGKPELERLMDSLEYAGAVTRCTLRAANRGKARHVFVVSDYHNAVA